MELNNKEKDQVLENNMACDLETGICEIPERSFAETEVKTESEPKENKENGKVDVFYVTDPICSYCWCGEPHLRKFQTLYKDKVNFHIVMGGLLEKWTGFSDTGNGINSPADVGAHWREASSRFGMPIDGTVWEKDPIMSSYPPSIVYKLVKNISKTSSDRFLRSIREQVMVFNRNIAKDDVLEEVLYRLDRNGKKIVADSKTEASRELLNQDFKLAASLRAYSFPTVVFVGEDGNGLRVSGTSTFETYEDALTQIAGEIEPNPLPELIEMFNLSRNIFFKEIEVMYDLEPEAVLPFIELNLPENTYEVREILGYRYIIKK